MLRTALTRCCATPCWTPTGQSSAPPGRRRKRRTSRRPISAGGETAGRSLCLCEAETAPSVGPGAADGGLHRPDLRRDPGGADGGEPHGPGGGAALAAGNQRKLHDLHLRPAAQTDALPSNWRVTWLPEGWELRELYSGGQTYEGPLGQEI